jgi:hypothetical protein
MQREIVYTSNGALHLAGEIKTAMIIRPGHGQLCGHCSLLLANAILVLDDYDISLGKMSQLTHVAPNKPTIIG